MKKKAYLIILSIFILLKGFIYADDSSPTPLETAILKLPDNSEANWKEISRFLSNKEGSIETIPLNQTIQDWSELICIQYIDTSEWKKNIDPTLDSVLDCVRKETLSSYPEKMVTWNIIEKNQDDVIYEWILHKSYKNNPPQHEISRAFLTKRGLHRVGFTRKNGQMSLEEREKWVNLLKENSSVVSFQEGRLSPALSMVEKLRDSVSLGPNFLDWKKINTYAFENGFTAICYIPSTHIGSYVTECLELVTMPNVNAVSLNQFFEAEKKLIREKTDKKVNFRVIERSPCEIIYSYSHPKDHLQCNAVVRIFISERGYYSFSYKLGLTGSMQKEEILLWKDRLKTINIS